MLVQDDTIENGIRRLRMMPELAHAIPVDQPHCTPRSGSSADFWREANSEVRVPMDAAAKSAGAIAIEPASAWDILLLLGEVHAGAGLRFFNPEQGSAREQIVLALRCARAILAARGLMPASGSSVFLAARRNGNTLGTAFVNALRDDDGTEFLALEYVVVDARFRGTGAGTALLKHLMSAGRRIDCWCTPWSTSMHRLLKKVGFKRLQKTTTHANDADKQTVLPALWRWRADDKPAGAGRNARAGAVVQAPCKA